MDERRKLTKEELSKIRERLRELCEGYKFLLDYNIGDRTNSGLVPLLNVPREHIIG